MPIAALDHINISTNKLAETRAFFVDLLGLTEGDRPPFGFPGHWLYIGGHPIVHLVGRPVNRLPSAEAALDHFALRADGYDDLKARLDAVGLRYDAVDVPGSATRQIFVDDPNGVTVELNFPGP
jgi:catechol 2,3-dioxygenase-like lactoylglutathione lyase family enzyme